MTFTNEDTTTIVKSILLCVSNTLMSVQKMVTESLAACPDAPSLLISAKKTSCSVQKSIFTGINGLSDKSFQSKVAPKMHSVGFYVHNYIPTTSWRVKTCKGANRELLATLEIATATKPVAIHNVYNHLNKLKVDPLLSYLDSYTGHTILLGDFNYHHEDWNSDQKTETSTSCKKFAEGVKAHNYILKTKQGAITYSNSKDVSKRSSTIDLTFAKESISASIGYCEVLQVPGFLSDHRVIETSVKRAVKTDVETMPCWHKITPNKFQRRLKPRLPPLDSPVGNEEQVVAFFAKVIDALHVTMMENVPRRSCDLRPQAQRTMQLASKLRKRLAELGDLKKKDQTPKTLKRILFLERDIDKLNTEMWSESDRDKTRPPSTRAFFNVFRLAMGRSQPLEFAQTPTLKYEGDSDAGNEPQLAVTDEQKIEMIKKVKFRNNNNPESTRILEEPGPRHDPKREDIHIPRDVDAKKLRTIIKGLKNNKAPGPDKVPKEAIKLGMELLLPYFVLGFRACLHLSLHPANFKDSIIVMLLKAGKEPDKPESYRPISLLSTVGKLYERILADMMLDALKEHPHLLPATQFGNKTTTEALQYLFRIIYSTWCSNSDGVVTILGLNMSSAYDNVYRQKLLQILYDKGFPMCPDYDRISTGITDVYFLPQIHHGMRPGRVVQRFVDRRRLLIQQILQFPPGNILLVLQIIATLLIGIKREVNEALQKATAPRIATSLIQQTFILRILYHHKFPFPALEMLMHPSSVARMPRVSFLDLPLELRQQVYHEYFRVDGDSDKLAQADRQPISISLRYACRSVAEETKSFPFKLNSITFWTLYRKDLQHQAAIHSNLIRFYTVLLSELLLRMRRYVTPEMFVQVDEVAPQYLRKIKSCINCRIRDDEDDGSLFCREEFRAVTEFDKDNEITVASLDWNDSTIGFQRAIVCILRQVSAKNSAEIAKAVNEVLPGWTDSASPDQLFDMSFDHWDIPSLPRLTETAERLQRHRFLDSLDSWLPIQHDDPRWFDARYKGPKYTYHRKYWFSATAVAIRFLTQLSSTQRRYLQKLVLNEGTIAVGFPESHAIGIIPFCKENPNLHVEQRVDVWQNLVMSSECPSAYGLNGVYFEGSEPQAGEDHCLDSIFGPEQDVFFSNWVVHGMEVVRAGMPVGSWSVVFDGNPDLNLATDLFTTLLKRTIGWQTFYTDCVSLGLFADPSPHDYPFATVTSDERAPERMRSSIFQCNFNIGRPWNLDEIAANYNIHEENFKWELDYWLQLEVGSNSPGPLDFSLAGSTVDLEKLRLGCFERKMISDH
ncbi:hypothetical protein FPRO03_04938 [Fusarium proliferatum]|nr:hypothetical protein FPRO03_04938 [Fusarium proliferatum]